jgi:methyl-accepting chemotaxis protein
MSNTAHMLQSIQEEAEDDARRFVSVISVALLVLTAVVLAMYSASGEGSNVTFIVLGCLLALEVSAAVLSRIQMHLIAGHFLFFGAVAVVGVGGMLSPATHPDGIGTLVESSYHVFVLCVVCIGFLAGRRSAVALAAVAAGLCAATLFVRWGDYRMPDLALATGVVLIVILGVTAMAMWSFTSRHEEVVNALYARVDEMGRVMDAAQRISKGDLTVRLFGEGEAADVLADMVDNLRELVANIQGTANQVNAATAQLAAMARQQQRGANRQSAAIVQEQATLLSLVDASRRIAEAAGSVRRNSESALDTNRDATGTIRTFARSTEELETLLSAIRIVAVKTETLAVNAVIEGRRAGREGLGFSMVAEEMQLLAEGAMQSLGDVQRLTQDFNTASDAAVSAIERATEQTESTTEASRSIDLVTQAQRDGTSQLEDAMRDIGHVTNEVNQNAEALLQSAEHMRTLSLALERAIADIYVE